jgi:subtilase family serine protease
MSRILRSVTLSSACVALAALCAPSVAGATPILPHAQAQDVGATPAAETVTASLVLKVQHPDALETFVALSQEPGLPTFHRFLSVREFAQNFAPSQADIANITRYLNSFGITVDEVFADRLLIHATGTVDAFNRAFEVDMHNFTDAGKRFRRPRHSPRIPLLLRDLLVSVGGFSTEPMAHPMNMNASVLAPSVAPRPVVLPQGGAIATGVPGSFTVGDFANLYNVNPLYDAALDGTGRTVGIATLANFLPADAFSYWSAIGLNVDPNRLTQVHVDGGGELSSAAGSGETALDVEQSGGLAPGAKVVVYDAPNTSAGFIDLFYKAASDNLVDSLSCSWGEPEVFFFQAVVGVDATAELVAFHQAFLEAAAQGISVFVAAGDAGAFDINRAGFNVPVLNVLTVDHPAGDPAVTAAGGTTTPVTLNFRGATAPLVVSTEQVWGWDYIENFFVAQFGDQFLHFLFPVGGGGGVSIAFGVPEYQRHTQGIRRSEPHQSIIFDDGSGSGPQDLLDLPAHFAGRNVPDISADADPETGYLLLSTPDGGLLSGFGGTSFVAPQLNGVSALLSQASGGRLGLWNPMLYRFQREFAGRSDSPIVDIAAGDNWFYSGVRGFEPGAGLGVLNVAKLAAAIQRDNHHH